jgi:hypothetical protein
MKEFELQGDISSGFCWRVKGTGEQELAEVKGEPFVPLGDPPESALIPLGDPPGSKGCARIQSEREDARTPSGEEIVFDLDYDLLLFSERQARYRMLYPWRLLPREVLVANIDPFVALELHRQEVRDKELRDLLDALLGKASDWRSALCIEAQRNDYARDELGRIMGSSYAKVDTGEAGRFLEALKAVDRLKKGVAVKTAKAWALVFVLGCRVKAEPLPTRGEVLRFLASRGIEVSKNNAARDIFTGPILGDLSQDRAGRPKKTRPA